MGTNFFFFQANTSDHSGSESEEEVETEVETEVEEEVEDEPDQGPLEESDILKKAVRRHEYELLRKAGIGESLRDLALTVECNITMGLEDYT